MLLKLIMVALVAHSGAFKSQENEGRAMLPSFSDVANVGKDAAKVAAPIAAAGVKAGVKSAQEQGLAEKVGKVAVSAGGAAVNAAINNTQTDEGQNAGDENQDDQQTADNDEGQAANATVAPTSAEPDASNQQEEESPTGDLDLPLLNSTTVKNRTEPECRHIGGAAVDLFPLITSHEDPVWKLPLMAKKIGNMVTNAEADGNPGALKGMTAAMLLRDIPDCCPNATYGEPGDIYISMKNFAACLDDLNRANLDATTKSPTPREMTASPTETPTPAPTIRPTANPTMSPQTLAPTEAGTGPTPAPVSGPTLGPQAANATGANGTAGGSLGRISTLAPTSTPKRMTPCEKIRAACQKIKDKEDGFDYQDRKRTPSGLHREETIGGGGWTDGESLGESDPDFDHSRCNRPCEFNSNNMPNWMNSVVPDYEALS